MLFTHIHSPVVCSAVFLNNRPRHNEVILLHKTARSSGCLPRHLADFQMRPRAIGMN